MFDLLAMAFQADLTRVFTFMMSREGSQRTFAEIGVPDPWHVVSHHGDQAEKVARAAKINVLLRAAVREVPREAAQHAGRRRVAARHSLLFYGSGMGNSNVHATDPLPMLAVGGGVGTGNRHIVLPQKTEIGNLWLTVANKFGAHARHVRREHRHGRFLLNGSRSAGLSGPRVGGPERAALQ